MPEEPSVDSLNWTWCSLPHVQLTGSPNAVWSYETPYPAMAAIQDHLAFYPQQVTVERSA